MPGCVVLGCTSGYKSNKEKTHLFTVPRDANALELWKIAIRRADIKPGQSVCEKHFRSEQILWQRELRSPAGVVIGISPYKIPRLVKGSTPSIFPWTEFSVINDENFEKTSVEDDLGVMDDGGDQSAPPAAEQEELGIEKKTENVYSKLSTGSSELVTSMTFDVLLKSNPSLPVGWAKHTMISTEIVILFCKFDYIRVGELLKTYPLKEVVIKNEMSVQVNVLSVPVNIMVLKFDVTPIRSIEQLENLLLSLDALNVCTGSRVQKELEQVDCVVAKKDASGTWRHVKCCLLLSDKTVCTFCQRIKKTVARKIRRTKIREEPKRIRLRLSPTKKKKLLILKKKVDSVQRANRRGRCVLFKLKNKLNECQDKLNSISDESLDDILKTPKLEENQKHALKEIISVAKAKDSKGRRYSEEWLLLCMLLHMLSASGYNFLRVNNILPLPCPRTVRRYLSKINTSCGFDPQFFDIMKLALSKKEDIQKHGILLLDEIGTRESVNVETKSLTYKGLIDFGVDGEKSSNFSDKANHGLVIMFQSLIDNFAQPIAVFASRGPVKGLVLAQLIIKAIVLLENVGARIHGVVTDGASTNRKFWSEMGVSGNKRHFKNFFEHPSDEGRRVFVFSDTPHLIKTIRNRLFNEKVLQMDPNQSPIRWKHFEILHEKDKELAGPSEILVCPKLTVHHLFLSNAQKMRVKLAVQVFSNSVANGLRFFQNHDERLNDCEETASFCEWMNKMFDALNRKQIIDGVQPGNRDFKIIQESIEKLDRWQENVDTGRLSEKLFLTTQTAEGLRVTLQSTLDIVTYLTQHCGFTSVLTGRINQDPLEVRSFSRHSIFSIE